MEVTIGKLISIAVAITYVIAVFVAGAPLKAIGAICLALLLPVGLIWFPDEIGSISGYIGRGGLITTETPGFLITAAGWFLLLGYPVLLYLVAG